MKLFSVYFILVITLCSCNSESKKNENLESKILGKWIFAREHLITTYDNDGFEVPPPPHIEKLGYNFFSKDSCEANQMFVDLKTFDVDYYQPIGRKTIYKIENDSLKIFNRTFNKWDSFYIMRLDTNNLVLNNKNYVIQQFVHSKKE